MLRVTEGSYAKLKGKKPSVKRARDTFYAKRSDKNQPDIMSSLRKLGFSVKSLHETGGGIFDLLVSKNWLTVLCEVKDGIKPPSAREFTPAQRKFNFEWQGLRCVLTCHADCVRFSQSVNAILQACHENNIKPSVTGCQERQYAIGLYP